MRPSNKTFFLPYSIIIKLEGNENNSLLKIDYILHSVAIQHWRNLTLLSRIYLFSDKRMRDLLIKNGTFPTCKQRTNIDVYSICGTAKLKIVRNESNGLLNY